LSIISKSVLCLLLMVPEPCSPGLIPGLLVDPISKPKRLGLLPYKREEAGMGEKKEDGESE
ncbi:hypothetical protein P7K49_011901, partial [Saguinus oedipus]